LLGGLGCGRFLAEACIEHLSTLDSTYDYVTLQATDNSISFYESLGFKRVGAVARYSLRDQDDEQPLVFNAKEAIITSKFYW
jgi:ribosomal protein S18 acetylase RimI-like enzyme